MREKAFSAQFRRKTKEFDMNNRGLLIVIAVLLTGILGIMAVQYQQREKPLDQRIADSVHETVEEIGDEIDDHTASR
jgi:NADH:ubiquinone oxidoreductase subunit 6 (subunit J)